MMKAIINTCLLLCLAMILGCGFKVKIDDELETIPKDVALRYLQDESGKFSNTDQCIYSKYGVDGVPYTDLMYEQNIAADPWIRVYHKDDHENRPRWFGFEHICSPAFFSIWDRDGMTDEEIQDGINRICTALESLGVKRGAIVE